MRLCIYITWNRLTTLYDCEYCMIIRHIIYQHPVDVLWDSWIMLWHDLATLCRQFAGSVGLRLALTDLGHPRLVPTESIHTKSIDCWVCEADVPQLSRLAKNRVQFHLSAYTYVYVHNWHYVLKKMCCSLYISLSLYLSLSLQLYPSIYFSLSIPPATYLQPFLAHGWAAQIVTTRPLQGNRNVYSCRRHARSWTPWKVPGHIV